jgi:hypothetical protein
MKISAVTIMVQTPTGPEAVIEAKPAESVVVTIRIKQII